MEVEFLAWLEAAAQTLLKANPMTACVVGVMPDGSVLTAYYNATTQDKAVMAHNITSDAMLDTVLANIDQIREALEGG